MFILKKNSTFLTCIFFFKKKHEKNLHFNKSDHLESECGHKKESLKKINTNLQGPKVIRVPKVLSICDAGMSSKFLGKVWFMDKLCSRNMRRSKWWRFRNFSRWCWVVLEQWNNLKWVQVKEPKLHLFAHL